MDFFEGRFGIIGTVVVWFVDRSRDLSVGDEVSRSLQFWMSICFGTFRC